MSADRDQVAPLAIANDVEESPITKPRNRHRHRCFLRGAICAAALVIVAATVVFALALTVFRVKEPVMTMNNVIVQRLDVGAAAPASAASQPFAINLTVIADLSVKNPNAASVRFGASTTALYYRAREMGSARGPPGTARARRTFRINVTLDVTADRIFGDANLFEDLAAGSIAVATSTRVVGRVRVFGVFRRRVDVVMNCSFAMAVANRSFVDQRCRQKIRL